MKDIIKVKAWRQQAAIEKAKSKARQELSANLRANLLCLLDVSGSMAGHDAGITGVERRVDVLWAALKDIVDNHPREIAALAFNSIPFRLKGKKAPLPDGCTNLHQALIAAGPSALSIKNVVLISDGEPTDGMMEQSKKLVGSWHDNSGVIFSTIFCGPQGGAGEIFLRDLARLGGGEFNHISVRQQQLRSAVAALLDNRKEM